MNKANGSFTHFINDPGDTNSLGGTDVVALLREPDGDLWVGMFIFGGLDFYDHKTGKFKHILKNKSILCLFRDNSGTVWAGSDDGLYLMNDTTNGFKKFTSTGSRVDNSRVMSIKEHDGKLWITAFGEGILRMDPSAGRLLHTVTIME